MSDIHAVIWFDMIMAAICTMALIVIGLVLVFRRPR